MHTVDLSFPSSVQHQFIPAPNSPPENHFHLSLQVKVVLRVCTSPPYPLPSHPLSEWTQLKEGSPWWTQLPPTINSYSPTLNRHTLEQPPVPLRHMSLTQPTPQSQPRSVGTVQYGWFVISVWWPENWWDLKCRFQTAIAISSAVILASQPLSFPSCVC